MIYIGIDLGGTNIAVGAVDESGKIIGEFSTKTFAQRPYQDIIRDMAFCIGKILKNLNLTEDDIASIGIGIPGVADQKTERVIFCTNLGWHDIPLGEELRKYYNKPIHIDNDATVAGYAEYVAGVSKGTDSSVFITLGTGVGAGIVINGKPWSGYHGIGSEIGHMTIKTDGVQCTCGNKGCAERYCSASAIIRMAKEALADGSSSMIVERARGDINRINAKIVIDCAKEGDAVAVRVFDEYARCLAVTINNLTDIIDPEIIVLGGGVSHAGQFLLDSVQKHIPSLQLYKTLPYPRISLASLGNEAGIIGAAMLGR